MQDTGQGSEKRSYRVILLLIVGLAAFSSAMKELNQVHELTLQTGQLLAQWTGPLAHENEMLAKVESCDSKIPVPPVPALPSLPAVPTAPPEVEVVVSDVLPQVAPPAPVTPPAKPRRVIRVNRDAAATAKTVEIPDVRIIVSTEEILDKAFKQAFEADVNQKALKARNRRHIWIGSEGRDVILKSLNRTINLGAS